MKLDYGPDSLDQVRNTDVWILNEPYNSRRGLEGPLWTFVFSFIVNESLSSTRQQLQVLGIAEISSNYNRNVVYSGCCSLISADPPLAMAPPQRQTAAIPGDKIADFVTDLGSLSLKKKNGIRT